MTEIAIENIRIDTEIGDGVLFTTDVHGVSLRFFVSRQTLCDLERSFLADNHDMLASFERQRDKVKQAVLTTLKFGTSHNVTFLKTDFFH